MKLLGDRLLCKKIAQETKSGLILPTNHEKDNDFGVMKIGAKVKSVKVGDTVRKFKYSDGLQMIEEGVEYLVLKESEDIDVVF
ncbi:chaperonin [Flavobacterium sp. HSC-61S13]|uniref:chaperonin n=1 Tax=Flavobacterium sp. HSC-61S13 TaxID=2910963 RepID=UPI0020A20BCD|nr:chaperonin [Flavobacterium sp. HSC-61S13]MCP1996672.1 co-chaperonin GroES (HSP10) [Flavobacterium sp. HSC-61S13]